MTSHDVHKKINANFPSVCYIEDCVDRKPHVVDHASNSRIWKAKARREAKETEDSGSQDHCKFCFNSLTTFGKINGIVY